MAARKSANVGLATNQPVFPRSGELVGLALARPAHRLGAWFISSKSSSSRSSRGRRSCSPSPVPRHVILAQKLMGLDPASPEQTFLLIMLHTGTMAAVIVYFWLRWKPLLFPPKAPPPGAAAPAVRPRFLWMVLLATLVTGAGVGLILLIEKVTHAEVEELFGRLDLIAAALLAVGVFILVAGFLEGGARREAVTLRPALLIGLVQAVCLPFRGFSRSGATISTGLLCGVSRRSAEDFSFALAVLITPAAIGRMAYRLFKTHGLQSADEVLRLLLPGLVGMALEFRGRLRRPEAAFLGAGERPLEMVRLLLPRGGRRVVHVRGVRVVTRWLICLWQTGLTHSARRVFFFSLDPPPVVLIMSVEQRRSGSHPRRHRRGFFLAGHREKNHEVGRRERCDMDFSLSTYYPIFIYLVVVVGFAVSAIVVPPLIAPKRKTPVKQMPYESGMDPIGDARQHFDVKFYLIAILFLVFDVELLFLYPWAASPIGRAAADPGGVRSWSSSGRCWRSWPPWSWPTSTPGGRGCSNGGRACPKTSCSTQARPAGQLGAQEQPVADAVRHGLLRHRADGDRRLAARHRPLRRRGHALQPAAVRPDDRRRPRGHEDAAGAAAHLAANAGAEMVHFDGRLRLQRRRLRHLRRRAGHRSLHPGRHVRARLSAAAGAAAPVDHRPAGQDSRDRHAHRHGVQQARRGPRRRSRWRLEVPPADALVAPGDFATATRLQGDADGTASR